MNVDMKRIAVIQAVELCDMNETGEFCKECPYREREWDGAWIDGDRWCYDELREDVVAYLKEGLKD